LSSAYSGTLPPVFPSVRIAIGFLLNLSGYAVVLGASEIPKEARQTQPPEYLEDLQKQLDDTKNPGLIVLLCTLTYMLVWLVLH
jgi:hypothetical protein